MPLSFPLKFEEVILWLAFNALTLLVTWQVLSPHYGKTNIAINHKRLEKATLVVTILFLVTIVIRIIDSSFVI